MLVAQSCLTVALRFLCSWNSPGKSTGVGCHSLLRGIFLTKGLNPGLLHCHLSHPESARPPHKGDTPRFPWWLVAKWSPLMSPAGGAFFHAERAASPLRSFGDWDFFFNWFTYFNWKLITLQHCGGFCHTLTWIAMGVHVSPILNRTPHLPPHPIPQGCPSTLALRALLHASNLDWWSISHMIIYMFQCYSLKSSHPHLLPQSPKVCSLYLCLFCCSHIRSSLPSF